LPDLFLHSFLGKERKGKKKKQEGFASVRQWGEKRKKKKKNRNEFVRYHFKRLYKTERGGPKHTATQALRDLGEEEKGAVCVAVLGA